MTMVIPGAASSSDEVDHHHQKGVMRVSSASSLSYSPNSKMYNPSNPDPLARRDASKSNREENKKENNKQQEEHFLMTLDFNSSSFL